MFGKKKNQEAEELVTEEVQENSQNADMEDFEKENQEEIKPKKKKLPGWVIIPIIAVLLLVAFGASKLSGPSKKAVTQLQVTKVKKGDVKEIYNTSGVLESEHTKTFYSPVTAPVANCNAKVGTAVKTGDMLITFDLKDLEKNNTESSLNLQSTQASNQSSLEQDAKAANSAAQAQADAVNQLNAQMESTANQLNAAQNQVAELQAQAENENAVNAQIVADNKKIDEQNAPIQAEIDTRKKEIENLKIEMENLNILIKSYNSTNPPKNPDGTVISEWELGQKWTADNDRMQKTLPGEIAQFTAQLTPRKVAAGGDAAGKMAEAQAQVDSLSAALNALQNQSLPATPDIGMTSGAKKGMAISENLAELSLLSVEELLQKGRNGIKAEFDGVVSDVKAIAGTSMAQGGELFTLVNNKSLNLKLAIPSGDFDKLIVGNKATITVGQKTYKGTLSSVDKIALANAKGNPVIGAKIHIDNPDDSIIIGVTAKAKLNVAEAKNVLMISNEVVNTATNGDFVYVIKNGVVKKQNVELGIASNNDVEVKSGLKEGDQVVSDTSSTVKEGMKATATGKTGSK
ncbi:MAG: HlyD family efflux transporter periplasmic adaptor subunit [Lachnospiraceae bacterium]